MRRHLIRLGVRWCAGALRQLPLGAHHPSRAPGVALAVLLAGAGCTADPGSATRLPEGNGVAPQLDGANVSDLEAEPSAESCGLGTPIPKAITSVKLSSVEFSETALSATRVDGFWEPAPDERTTSIGWSARRSVKGRVDRCETTPSSSERSSDLFEQLARAAADELLCGPAPDRRRPLHPGEFVQLQIVMEFESVEPLILTRTWGGAYLADWQLERGAIAIHGPSERLDELGWELRGAAPKVECPSLPPPDPAAIEQLLQDAGSLGADVAAALSGSFGVVVAPESGEQAGAGPTSAPVATTLEADVAAALAGSSGVVVAPQLGGRVGTGATPAPEANEAESTGAATGSRGSMRERTAGD